AFNAEDHKKFASQSNQLPIPRPLSVYVHIPFCQTLCYYCGCTKIVTRNQQRVTDYLGSLYREIELQAALFDKDRVVEQLHFGGGTPTYLAEDQLREVMRRLSANFDLQKTPDREFSIEIDPRTVDLNAIDTLAELGFNRLSMGIQDFDPQVQKAVNRIQSEESVRELTEKSRAAGFESISFDLIYGLPGQTVESFSRTLDTVIDLAPDRIAVYNYAHLPQRFKGQRMIKSEEIPSPDVKLDILNSSISKLIDARYEYIGMDHFALPDDELAVAQRTGELQRNFQGYSTHRSCDLIGLGISSISHIGDSFSQNVVGTASYAEILAQGKLPIQRGLVLNDDDRLRGAVIQQMMCFGYIDFDYFSQKFNIDFTEYFAAELQRLKPLEEDNLITTNTRRVDITTRGRLLLRTVARVFDIYSGDQSLSQRFSQTI
ncbi:MAG TPA: oxygen-independent coproporphyrinogen III oxidase, partial [Woeseiaceae bacterium]